MPLETPKKMVELPRSLAFDVRKSKSSDDQLNVLEIHLYIKQVPKWHICTLREKRARTFVSLTEWH